MAMKNLTEALFERKVSREKFMELFLKIVRTGEDLIMLLRRCEPRLFESIRVPADELIEQWELHLRDVIFLAFGGKAQAKKKKDFH